jgi:hypothetical protein
VGPRVGVHFGSARISSGISVRSVWSLGIRAAATSGRELAARNSRASTSRSDAREHEPGTATSWIKAARRPVDHGAVVPPGRCTAGPLADRRPSAVRDACLSLGPAPDPRTPTATSDVTLTGLHHRTLTCLRDRRERQRRRRDHGTVAPHLLAGRAQPGLDHAPPHVGGADDPLRRRIDSGQTAVTLVIDGEPPIHWLITWIGQFATPGTCSGSCAGGRR